MVQFIVIMMHFILDSLVLQNLSQCPFFRKTVFLFLVRSSHRQYNLNGSQGMHQPQECNILDVYVYPCFIALYLLSVGFNQCHDNL